MRSERMESILSNHRNLCDRRRCFYVSCRLAVSEAWLALADFYYVAIGITHVAARLAVLFLWLRDKLGSSTAP